VFEIKLTVSTTLPVLRRTVDSSMTVGKVRKNSESLLLEAGAVAGAFVLKADLSYGAATDRFDH
jgi:hypothetical protein